MKHQNLYKYSMVLYSVQSSRLTLCKIEVYYDLVVIQL